MDLIELALLGVDFLIAAIFCRELLIRMPQAHLLPSSKASATSSGAILQVCEQARNTNTNIQRGGIRGGTNTESRRFPLCVCASSSLPCLHARALPQACCSLRDMEAIEGFYNQSVEKQDELAEKLRITAENLHNKILNELEHIDYDVYKRDFNATNDPMVLQSKLIMQNDMKLRKKAGGPSIRRLKFQAPYWKQWHSEKTLLDHISQKELERIENIKTQPKAILSKSKMIEKQQKERFLFKNAKANKNNIYFDKHLLGDTNVKFMLNESLNVNVPKEDYFDSSCNAYISNGTNTTTGYKGFIFSRSTKLAKLDVSKLQTQNCDIPPLPGSIKSGGKFTSSSSRFNSTSSSGGNDHDNNAQSIDLAATDIFNTKRIDGRIPNMITAEKGFHFNQAIRFNNSTSGNEQAHAPPGPGEYNVCIFIIHYIYKQF
jgi:hypothetical protein